MDNTYMPKPVKILEKKQQTVDTFSFKLDWKARSEPGQILEASVPLIGEAPFGFASHGKDYVELLVRDVGNVTNGLARMKAGEMMFVRGPYGKGFPMKESRGKNIYILAGGTGIAPVKAVVEYIIKHRKDYGEVHLFIGFRSPKHIVFGGHFEEWKRSISLHVSVDSSETKCPYEVCRVTDMLAKAKIPPNSVAFTCGPPVMMQYAAKAFLGKGLKENEIHVSLERNMHCGMGKCGRCMVGDIFICKDGPVFPYDIAKRLED